MAAFGGIGRFHFLYSSSMSRFLSTFPPTNCNEYPWYNRQILLGILIEMNRKNCANPKLKTVGNAKLCCGIPFTTHSLSCMIQPVTTLFTQLIRCIQNLYHIVKLHNFLVLGMVWSRQSWWTMDSFSTILRLRWLRCLQENLSRIFWWVRFCSRWILAW